MSIHIIHNTFNLEKISIQEPERYNQDLYIWPIQYNHEHMFIQTSYLNIINALQYFNNISLSCYHKPIQESKKKFNTMIKDIDTYMINEIKQLKKNIKHKKKLVPFSRELKISLIQGIVVLKLSNYFYSVIVL